MVLDLLRQRRSIRVFEQRAVETEKIRALLEAALRSPASRGRNPWEFVVVTEPARRALLAQAKQHGAGFLKDAPLLIAVVADPAKCDVWVEDCSIAAIIIQLAAESLGLKSCWAQLRLRTHADGRDAEAPVREILELPAQYVAPVILGIGYPAETKSGHPPESLDWSKVHRERFGQPF